MEQLNVATATPPALSVSRPRKPSALVPDFLHRGHDGFIPFTRKVGEEWQALGSVPAWQLRGLFADEDFLEEVDADSYFGLHGMYRAGRYKQRHQLSQLEPSCRSVDSVRWITCCGLDLDSYKTGLDVHATIAAVMRLVDADKLPPPSLFTMSRGLWVIWRIHDREHTNEPLRAYPPEQMVSRHAKVQMALHQVCASIGSDAAAKHVATVSRIPGSINSKNGKRVAYMLPADIHGKPFSYTLEDLEAFMLPHKSPVVVDAKPVGIGRKTNNPKYGKRALKGWHGRWHRMRGLLLQLRNRRGGWKVGHRSAALLYVGMTLKAMKATDKEARRLMAQHLEGMEQPTGDCIRLEQALSIYKSIKKIRSGGPRHQTIADALDVTVDEAAFLSADAKKTPFPPATRHSEGYVPPPKELSRAEQAERRREAIRRIVEALGEKGISPTGVDVQAHLEAEGLGAALRTVLKDMQYVGCPSPRCHRDKPAPADTSLLPGF
jgi:hypothetical protein